MTNHRVVVMPHDMGITLLSMTAVALLLVGLGAGPYAHARDPSPLARVEALDLDTAQVGRVTAYFDSADRERAREYAVLADRAAAYFERELDLSFAFHLAVLTPEHWFNPYAGGDLEPYGMPWGWVEERLVTVPASLDEGLLIRGSDDLANLRRIRFVLLHEYGHLANKQYFHPGSPRPYYSIRWFEELFASYWAYAFIRSDDPEWAEAGEKMWAGVVERFTPRVLSLDWGWNVADGLPPDEWARTYAWYQNLLNLRAAELYDEQGLELLRAVKERLAWEEAGSWTTESLLASLEEIAPGFEAWARDLENGDYLPRDDE